MKMNNKVIKKIYIFPYVCFMFFFISCSSIEKINNNTEFTCFIVDENNNPVSECSVFIIKNDKQIECAKTNKNGFVFFNGIKNDTYTLSLMKPGVPKKNINFHLNNNCDKYYCFQFESKDYVFDSIEKLLKENKVNEALELLNTIFTNGQSELEVLIYLYKCYGFYLMSDKTACMSEIEKIKKIEKRDYSIFVDYSKLINLVESL